jgi:hypothetical protein
MNTARKARTRWSPAAKVLATGVGLMVAGGALLVAPAFLADSRGGLGTGLRAAAAYPMLLGVVLLAVWWLIRPRTQPAVPLTEMEEPTLFGKDTTEFQNDSALAEIESRKSGAGKRP